MNSNKKSDVIIKITNMLPKSNRQENQANVEYMSQMSMHSQQSNLILTCELLT